MGMEQPLLGLLHAYLTQKAKMNHVVSGLAINLLAAGATRYLFSKLFSEGRSIAGMSQSFFLLIAIFLPPLVWVLLHYTQFGLRLRAIGENPETVRMAGVNPTSTRYVAVVLSGVLAALAGAYLSMADSHRFSPNMSAGKGYIALAAVIFGKWNPGGATAGALFFGFFYALQTQLQVQGFAPQWFGPSSPWLAWALSLRLIVRAGECAR